MVTANNFLLIIFLMIAGLAVASDRLARSNLKSHQLFRRFPDEIYAETLFPIEYTLTGKSRRGSFALEFSENPPLGNLGSKVTFLSRRFRQISSGYQIFLAFRERRQADRIRDALVRFSI